MTGDELRTKVAHSIRATQASRDEDRVYDLADAAIAVVLAEVERSLRDSGQKAFERYRTSEGLAQHRYANTWTTYLDAAATIEALRSTERNEQ